MRPNPSDPERTVSVAIVATRLRSERRGELASASASTGRASLPSTVARFRLASLAPQEVPILRTRGLRELHDPTPTPPAMRASARRRHALVDAETLRAEICLREAVTSLAPRRHSFTPRGGHGTWAHGRPCAQPASDPATQPILASPGRVGSGRRATRPPCQPTSRFVRTGTSARDVQLLQLDEVAAGVVEDRKLAPRHVRELLRERHSETDQTLVSASRSSAKNAVMGMPCSRSDA